MSETEIIEFYSETKNNEDYTADGIPTIKKQLADIREEELKTQIANDEAIKRRDLIQRVKMLSLYKMDIDVFTDTRHMSKSLREKLQVEMHKYNEIEHEQIINEFNNIIGTILDEHKHIDKLPVYGNNYVV